MRLYTKILPLLFLVFSLAACGDIQHISELRESQTEFNRLSTQDNLQVLQVIYPTNAHVLSSITAAQPYPTSVDIDASQQAYANLSARLDALIKDCESQLQSDKLLNQALTLQLLAKSKASLYCDLAAAVKPPAAPAARDLPQELAQIAEQAEQLAAKLSANADASVGTRDIFVLASMKSMIRNNIAYVEAVRLRVSDLNSGSDDQATAKALVEQFATASGELSKVNVPNAAHIEEYRLLSRFVMLQNGHTLDVIYRTSEPTLKNEIDKFKTDYSSGTGKLVFDNLKPQLDLSLLGL